MQKVIVQQLQEAILMQKAQAQLQVVNVLMLKVGMQQLQEAALMRKA
jgi:hypothetical protein